MPDKVAKKRGNATRLPAVVNRAQAQTAVAEAIDLLNPKERLFVLAYLDNNGNATAAAREVGYASPAFVGWRLKNVERVKSAIRAAYAAAGVSDVEIVARLVEHVKANPVQFYDSKWRLKRSELEKRGHLIRKFRPPTRGRPAELELHDKVAALVHLGRHAGMFAEKIELGGTDGGPIHIQLSVAPKEITG